MNNSHIVGQSRRMASALAVLATIGLVMAASPSARAQNLTTLYSFCSQSGCTDGENPHTALIQAADGSFYGTTLNGGVSGSGTVFKITSSGALTTLYSFCSQNGCTDGEIPYGGLSQATDGNFYGTTAYGGANANGGTVFKITPSGTLTTLYTFCSQGGGCADGTNPYAGLIQATDGNLYGTTEYNGANAYPGGTVFKITPGGALTTLYSFCPQSGCADGRNPFAGPIQATDGNFYGTTPAGGANGPDDGTVFKITPSGALTTLYSFCSQGVCTDGKSPGYAALVQGTDGNFYGTTAAGGANSTGTVFKITPSGTLTTLYSFCSQGNCADGVNPYAGLVQATDGNFYGTTTFGGANGTNAGTIFKITPSGTLTTLYSFCPQSGCADGRNPYAGLIQATDGNLYGTTYTDGANGYGTVFKLALVPIASASPASLTFGNQDVGTTSPPQVVTLSNTGNAALAISIITTSGDFAETNNCGSSLPEGGSCAINVTFKPTATGTRTGTLTVTDNSNGVDGSQQSVSLTGTGINPGGSVSPTSLAFGNQAINTTSAVKKVTLTSSGTTNLMNISVTITGANSGDFAQSNNCPGTLNVGAKCTINVTFTPSALGARTATLDVNDNAANSPQTVALSGTGILPVALSPTSLNFGNQPEDITSSAKTVTLTNNLSTALAISSVTTSGDFAQTNTCGSSVPAKGKCTISVTFTPTALGARTGTLTVTDNASNSPQTASLTGTGIAQATVSPTSLTFAAQTVGTTSAAKNVTLTNNLSTALTINPITFTGADAGDFSQTNTCGTSLAAKSHCTISVKFKPAAKGTRTATMDVNDSANNSPQTVSLTGTGK